MSYLDRIVANSDDREAWLQARNNGITASNAAKLVSEKSIDSIIKSKFYDSFTGNALTEWGLEREPFLLSWAGFEQNKNLYHAVGEPRFMATPDGIKEVEGQKYPLVTCQVKTTSKVMKEIPPHYYRQVQWEMFVMEAVACVFVVEEHENFVPINLEPKLWVIERNDEAIASLTALAKVFLNKLDEANAFEKEMK